MLNIPATDIRLRPEFSELFQHADINVEDLVTLDDLPRLENIEKDLRPEDTRWILVDHNNLQGRLGSVYSSKVHGVIDHHDDEDSVPHDTEPEPRVIEKCGSCTSLVIRTLRSSWDTISHDDSSSSPPSSPLQNQGQPPPHDITKEWDLQLAKLALGSILIDTTNLTDEAKVEPADTEAVKHLELKILSSSKDDDPAEPWDRTKFYTALQTAKQNINPLSLPDILRKDYKQWPSKRYPSIILGISSVVKPLSFLVDKASHEFPNNTDTDTDTETAFNTAIKTFMQTHNLSLFAIMTSFSTHPLTATHKRELLLQATPDSTSSSAAIEAAINFAAQSSAELGLEPLDVPGIKTPSTKKGKESGGEWYRQVWNQKEVSKSRKQVAPLLRGVLD